MKKMPLVLLQLPGAMLQAEAESYLQDDALFIRYEFSR